MSLQVANMRAYLHNIGDWSSHTRGLTLAQSGAYHLLIEAYYTKESPLPGDVPTIARMIGATTTSEITAVRKILQDFFVHDVARNCYVHHRCDVEIAKYKEHCAQQRQKIEKRWAHSVTMSKTQKAIDSANRVRNEILAFPPSEPLEPNGHAMRLPSDTAGIPPELPLIKEVLNNTKEHTHLLVKQSAQKAAFVCVSNGVKVEESNTTLRALIAAGAGVADFDAASALAATRGKDFAFVAGVVRNRMSDAAMPLEGPQTGLGSTNVDPRMAFFVSPKKSL